MDEWTNGRMDEWTNGRMDEWSNGRMDGRVPKIEGNLFGALAELCAAYYRPVHTYIARTAHDMGDARMDEIRSFQSGKIEIKWK